MTIQWFMNKSYTPLFGAFVIATDSTDHIHFGKVLHVNNSKVVSLKQRRFLLSESQAECFIAINLIYTRLRTDI